MGQEMWEGKPQVPIAITGMACRLPETITDPEGFWDMMDGRQSAYSDIPTSRFHEKAFFHPNSANNGTFHTRGGHFLKQDISRFDAAFFNINPAEATAMDPQLRLLLEVAYEAFENSGSTLDQLRGTNTAAYVAMYNRDYEKILVRDPECLPFYAQTGNGEAMFSNRLSYFFDLRGASITLDTGCSGSMVALHQACEAIRHGESEQALVAGSNLILDPAAMIGPSFLKFYASDGKSKSFDGRADGYGRGEGVCCIVLKSLSAALKSGDPIRAVIRSSVINQDGRTPGITVPSGEAQERLIRAAYRAAHLDPANTAYIETHGSGTALGDLTESKALGAVFGTLRENKEPVLIGSVKTNIGHLENVSGLAATIKAALVISKRRIPPTLNLERPNQDISWKEWSLKVATESLELDGSRGGSQVSLNSFGYGGTNVHIVLDGLRDVEMASFRNSATTDNNTPTKTIGSSRPYVFPLSARSKESGKIMASKLQDYLTHNQGLSEGDLESLAYTLSARRSVFPWRTAVVADSVSTLREQDWRQASFHHAGKRCRVGFAFTGQGAQWATMGQELFETEPVFRESIVEAEQCLLEFGAEWKLHEEISKPADESQLERAAIAQPASTAVQLAIVSMLASWGVHASAVTGHSSGEIAAAYACGAVSFRDAMLIAYARGCAAGNLSRDQGIEGAMLAVGLDAHTAQGYITQLGVQSGLVTVACVNSPQSVTISGDKAPVLELQEKLQTDGVFVRALRVEVAYHSHHMHRVAGPYKDMLLSLEEPRANATIPFYSSVEGTIIDSSHLNADYWVKNLVSPVLFSTAIQLMTQSDSVRGSSVDMVVEIGPHSALKGPIKQILGPRAAEIPYAPTFVRKTSARQSTLELAADLFRNGHNINIGIANFGTNNTLSPACLHDLPPYQWDHSISYWHESRLSKNYRNRTDPPHELLGVLSPESSSLESRWRNFISASSVPWLTGHQIDGEIIFPAAGYMSMAFEAGHWHLMHAMNKPKSPCRIRLSQVSFGRSLVIPESGPPVELLFVLRPASEHAGRDLARRHEFVIFSFSSDHELMEHCRGFLSLTAIETSRPTPMAKNGRLASEKLFPVDAREIYRNLTCKGVRYTNEFERLWAVQAGERSCRAIVSRNNAEAYRTDMHPAAIDAFLQTIFPAIAPTGSIQGPIMPTYVQEASLMTNLTSSSSDILVASQIEKPFGHIYQADINATQSVLGCEDPLVLSIRGLEATVLDSQSSEEQVDDKVTSCQKVVFIPEPNFLAASDIEQICMAPLSPMSVASQHAQLERVCSYYALVATEEITEENVEAMSVHQRQYLQWLRKQARKTDPAAEAGSIETTIKDVIDLGSEGEMVIRIGEHLTSILKGDEDPLSLMVADGLLYRTYLEDQSMRRCAIQAGEYAKTLGRKLPTMNILEIGGGTGGATLPILQALSESERILCGHYTFTDVSAAFFPNAEKLFVNWKHLMKFQRLDVEGEPDGQGFELGQYDLIIAANVLHATKFIDRTLKNVRSLLKPTGKLLLIESTQPTVHRSFVFGTLPGWWLGSMERGQDHPLLTVDEWNTGLRKASFSGVDAYFHSYERPEEQTDSVIISTASESSFMPTENSVAIVWQGQQEMSNSTNSSEIADHLLAAMGQNRASLMPLGDPAIENRTCICLVDMHGSILSSLSKETLDALKATFRKAKETIWVTCGATSDCENPKSSLIHGLARAIRQEDPSIQITTVDLDPAANLTPQSITKSLAFFVEKHLTGQGADELEWTQRNGQWLVPRLVTDTGSTHYVQSKLGALAKNNQPHLENLIQRGRPLRLAPSSSGSLHNLHFIDHTSLRDPLAADELEIEVKASGVNFRDVMVSLGQFPDGLGGESSGIVQAVGEQLRDRFSVGDRVYSWYHTRFSTNVRTKGQFTHWMPSGFTFEEAASLPIIFSTAYHSLVNVAHLKKGETILIHSGAGGVGQAAIQIALWRGATVFTTVGSEKKKSELIRQYGIDPSRIFSSRSSEFASQIKEMTNGVGVDVVLNSLAGPILQASLDILAFLGRFLEIGKNDIQANCRMSMGVFERSTSFHAINLLHIAERNPSLIGDIFSRIHKLFETGILRPVFPITIFPMPQLEDAFRLIQKGENVGKLVISNGGNDLVKVVTPNKNTVSLDPDAAYLIVGGQGGLGRALSLWMARCGAKSVVILSPSGATKTSTKTLVGEMGLLGAKLHTLPCDVGNKAQLEATIAKCRTDLPPIRGIIQAALVLRDSSFDNMSAEDIHQVLKPKVTGSYNLHEVFGTQRLDFFVILSSYAGLSGSPGQANYAAASTFQDAFARWRTRQALPTVSLDIAAIQEAGFTHENPEAVPRLQKLGLGHVPLEALLLLVGYAVSTPAESVTSSQMAIGWSPGSTWNREVIDRRFSHLIPRAESEAVHSTETQNISDEDQLATVLAGGKSKEDLVAPISVFASRQVENVLGIPAEDIDLGSSISAHGGDSLVAVEFRNWFRKNLSSNFTVDEILSRYTLNELSTLAAQQVVAVGA